MACWKVSRSTLLVPYGLKTLLECLCRAIKLEKPRHIKQFFEAYCEDLLKHRDHISCPSKDLTEVIHLYQKMREHDQMKIKSWPMEDSLELDQVLLPSGEPAEQCQNLTRSVSFVSHHLADDTLAASQSEHDQLSLAESGSPPSPSNLPIARVQSAVFQRVLHVTEVQGTVEIDSARAPPADVIVVHSENLPGAIVFHCASRPASGSSARSSATNTPYVMDVDRAEECGLQMGPEGMVVFERVPSKEDFLPLQSPVELVSCELQNVDPFTTIGQVQTSEHMEQHPEVPKVREPLEDKVDSMTLASICSEEKSSEITEADPTPQTLQTDASSTHPPDNFSQSEIPQTCTFKSDTVSPHHTGLNREEEKDVSRSRGTTDRGTSPIIFPKTSSVLGCVHATTQVSGLSGEVTHTHTQEDQSPASGSRLPGPSCSGEKTTTPPTKSVQTERTEAEEQHQHTVDAAAGRGALSPCVEPVARGSANQMWTLYHLPHSSEQDTLCTSILSEPPFSGSAYIRTFGPGHVLLTERPPPPSCHDLRQACGVAAEGTSQTSDQRQPRTRDAAPAPEAVKPRLSSASLPDSDTRTHISLPNYLLCIDHSTQQVRTLTGAPGGPAASVRVRRDDASGVLTLSFPTASLRSAQGGSGQAQFLQITTDEGQSVYSPAVLRIATHHADPNE